MVGARPFGIAGWSSSIAEPEKSRLVSRTPWSEASAAKEPSSLTA